MKISLKPLFFALLTGALIGSSCTLDPECEWQDLYPEFENYGLVEGLNTTSIVLMGPEFDPGLSLGTSFILRTDSAYDALTKFSRDEGCNFCNYPDIDFSQYTLVGFTTEINCQALNYVKIYAADGQLHYALKTVDQTQCNQLLCDNFSFNWVLLPKAADTTDLNFETGVARFFCDC